MGINLHPGARPRAELRTSSVPNSTDRQKTRALHVCDSSVALREEPWHEKFEKNSKNLDFWRLRILKMHVFARNDQNRSKFDKVKAGHAQIDPRGSGGARTFESVRVIRERTLTAR